MWKFSFFFFLYFSSFGSPHTSKYTEIEFVLSDKSFIDKQRIHNHWTYKFLVNNSLLYNKFTIFKDIIQLISQ